MMHERKRVHARAKGHGFTLLEVLIVVVIVGIIASLAWPSYQEYVAKTRRGEAAAALMEGAQALERYYSTNGRYVTSAGGNTLPAVFPAQVPATGVAYYTIGASGAPAENSYTLRATRAGMMATDDCGNLQINHAGARSLNSQASGKTVDECWRR